MVIGLQLMVVGLSMVPAAAYTAVYDPPHEAGKAAGAGPPDPSRASPGWGWIGPAEQHNERSRHRSTMVISETQIENGIFRGNTLGTGTGRYDPGTRA